MFDLLAWCQTIAGAACVLRVTLMLRVQGSRDHDARETYTRRQLDVDMSGDGNVI